MKEADRKGSRAFCFEESRHNPCHDIITDTEDTDAGHGRRSETLTKLTISLIFVNLVSKIAQNVDRTDKFLRICQSCRTYDP